MKGHCMCGSVSVTVIEEPDHVVFCHCDNCKRQSSSGGAYESFINQDKVQVEGPLQLYLDKNTGSGTPMERWFCKVCGCPIYSATPRLPGQLVLKMGPFQEYPKVTAEWFCKNKPEWEPRVDGAALFETSPPK